MPLTPRSNPFAAVRAEGHVYPDAIRQRSLLRPVAPLTVVDCRQRQPVAHVMAAYAPAGPDLFVLLKGQWSLADLLLALVERLGPSALFLSTWAANGEDLSRVKLLLDSGRLTDVHLLADASFSRRAPDVATQIRRQFGSDAIRTFPVHAKFALLAGPSTTVALRTSMNLDLGDAFEMVHLSHGRALVDFLTAVRRDCWATATGHGVAPRPALLAPRRCPAPGAAGATAESAAPAEQQRQRAADAALAPWRPGHDLYHLSAGDFSLRHAITAALRYTGPADVLVSTWTCGHADVPPCHALVQSGAARTVRLLLDVYTLHRERSVKAAIHASLGIGAVRFTRNHAKAVLMRGDRANLTTLTSANLNHNPRCEDFTLTDCPTLFNFLWSVYDPIFTTQAPTDAPAIGAVARDFHRAH